MLGDGLSHLEEEEEEEMEMEGNTDKEDKEEWRMRRMRLMSLISSASSQSSLPYTTRPSTTTARKERYTWGCKTCLSRCKWGCKTCLSLLLGPPFKVTSSLSPSLYVHVYLCWSVRGRGR
jgi:hypothetical protein